MKLEALVFLLSAGLDVSLIQALGPHTPWGFGAMGLCQASGLTGRGFGAQSPWFGHLKTQGSQSQAERERGSEGI